MKRNCASGSFIERDSMINDHIMLLVVEDKPRLSRHGQAESNFLEDNR